MQNTTDFIEVQSYGNIFPKKGTNARTPYEHQKKAMEALDRINQEQAYRTLAVLPTGGGKTYTASMWLLKNAIDKKKKILWIAHRQMLLDRLYPKFCVNVQRSQREGKWMYRVAACLPPLACIVTEIRTAVKGGACAVHLPLTDGRISVPLGLTPASCLQRILSTVHGLRPSPAACQSTSA